MRYSGLLCLEEPHLSSVALSVINGRGPALSLQGAHHFFIQDEEIYERVSAVRCIEWGSSRNLLSTLPATASLFPVRVDFTLVIAAATAEGNL